MTSLAWKINRIKLMGVPEVLWRVQQVAQKKVTKLGIGLASEPPAPDTSRFGRSFLHDGAGVDVPALAAAADAILAGFWNVFALHAMPLGFPPRWNRDPKTGTDAPMVLGKAIDYRSEKVVGDIKYLWEPSRHLELVTLAAAWRSTNDPRYLEGARTLLASWFDQCPYPQGVHWTSSLELAVRLLNWACAWHLLGGADSPLFTGEGGQRFQRRWLDNVHQHCHFISGYFSRHSSANNHLFGEYMGLFVACQTWPCWQASRRWLDIARHGLEEQAIEQNHADGVNKEQAIYYQHEVMDMMLLCQLVAQANGSSFSQPYMARLEKLADFVAAIMDRNGHVPMTGDADDAQMVRLAYGAGWCPYRSLLASCAILFKRGDLKAKAGAFDDKNRWLFGAEGERAWATLPEQAEHPVMAFPQGGYYLLGKNFGQPDEVRLVADCAPLGFLSIAAHGHADALSFTLSVKGQEILIDPGTYAYHTQKQWRDYFRSTPAHNTVTIDGVDQSEIAGAFMWMRKANARALLHRPLDAVQVFEGEHDGYTRLPDPVVHKRRIAFDAEANRIVVTDFLSCIAEHEVLLHWHMSETCSVATTKDGFTVSAQDVTLEFSCAAPGFELALLRAGEEAPFGGWISRSFDVKATTTTARWRGRIKGSASIVTTISIQGLAQGRAGIAPI